jgi:hypothetical protein
MKKSIIILAIFALTFSCKKKNHYVCKCKSEITEIPYFNSGQSPKSYTNYEEKTYLSATEKQAQQNCISYEAEGTTSNPDNSGVYYTKTTCELK